MIFKETVAVRWLAAAGAMLLCLGATAAMKTGRGSSLEDLTKGSDDVITGQVTSKSAVFAGRHIETTYQVKVTEALKGKMAAGSTFAVTVMGGDVTTPPISQFTELQAHMLKDENVVLFLKAPPTVTAEQMKRVNAQSKLLASRQIVGWNEGKFSVVTDLTDGKQKVTRVNLEDFGYIPTDTAFDKVMRAVASHDMTTTNGPAVQLGGGLTTTPDGKAVIDKALTAEGLTEIPKAHHASPSEITADLKKNHTIPLQDLQDFKDQVRKFAK